MNFRKNCFFINFLLLFVASAFQLGGSRSQPPVVTPSASKNFNRFKNDMIGELYELFNLTVFENKVSAQAGGFLHDCTLSSCSPFFALALSLSSPRLMGGRAKGDSEPNYFVLTASFPFSCLLTWRSSGTTSYEPPLDTAIIWGKKNGSF